MSPRRAAGAAIVAVVLALAASAPSHAIVGGQAAPAGAFPFIAFMDGGCTGYLVAPRWVATAHHCIRGPKPGTTRHSSLILGRPVTIGNPNGGSPTQVRRVVAYAHPPQRSVRERSNPDFALVALDAPVSIAPLAAGVDTPAPGTALLAMGFGGTRAETGGGGGGRLNVASQAVTDCRPGFAPYSQRASLLAQGTHCVLPAAAAPFAGGELRARGAVCFGDSGGPLVRWDPATGAYTGLGTLAMKRSWTCPVDGEWAAYQSAPSVRAWMERALARPLPAAVDVRPKPAPVVTPPPVEEAPVADSTLAVPPPPEFVALPNPCDDTTYQRLISTRGLEEVRRRGLPLPSGQCVAQSEEATRYRTRKRARPFVRVRSGRKRGIELAVTVTAPMTLNADLWRLRPGRPVNRRPGVPCNELCRAKRRACARFEIEYQYRCGGRIGLQRIRLKAGTTRLRVSGWPNLGKRRGKLGKGYYRVRFDTYTDVATDPSELAANAGGGATRIPPRSFVFRLQGRGERGGTLRVGR